MHISRLRLRNWKNFKTADIAFLDRAFIIGPNASGKSNLLDALRFLRDVSNDGLRKALDISRGGVSAVRCLAARQHSQIELHIEIKLSPQDPSPEWKYTLRINQDNNKRSEVTYEAAFHQETEVLLRPNHDDEIDPQRLSQTALEQISLNQPFRDVSDFLRSVSYQHILPQAVRDPRGFTGGPVVNDPFGRDFLLRVLQTTEKTRKSRLAKIQKALSAAVPQLKALDVTMDDSGVAHLLGSYEHWRPKAAKQNEAQFSDGTLRLLGLLWSMFEGAGPLLLEEPEISLHPEVVRQIPRMFARIQRDRKIVRQLIVSTHSDELLSDPSVALEEVVLLIPSMEGTTVLSPDAADYASVAAGMSAAEIMLPKAAPKSVQQLALAFD